MGNPESKSVKLFYNPKEEQPPGGWPLGPQGILEVGKFIVLWNLIEQQVDGLFMLITKFNSDAVDTIMRTPHVPSRADILLEVFKNLVEDQKLIKDAEICIKQIKDLSNFRNDVAHGRWQGVRISVGDGDHRLNPLVPMSSKQNFSKKMIRENDLKKNFEKIRRLSYRLADLTWRYGHYQGAPFHPLPSPYHDKF